MSRTVLQIGGHTVAVEGESAVRFLSYYNGATPFVAAADTAAEWTVSYDTALPPLSDYTLLSSFTYAETNSFCQFFRLGNSYRFTMADSRTGQLFVDMRYRSGDSRVVATECSAEPAVRFSLWFAVSMLAAALRVTFVHASTIVCHGRAVLFLGESGTGKSTHTRLWLQHIQGSRLLNDDSPVLAIEDGVPVAYGSPWSGKTPCYHNRRFPLAAVVRLSQAPHNVIRRLSTLEAFGALQPSIPPALMQDDRFADLLTTIASDTIASCPFYSLQCLPDADAARLSHDTIFSS